MLGASHPDDRDRVLAADSEAIANGEDFELEYRVIAADGRTVCFHEIVRIEIVDANVPPEAQKQVIETTPSARTAPWAPTIFSG